MAVDRGRREFVRGPAAEAGEVQRFLRSRSLKKKQQKHLASPFCRAVGELL